MPVIPVYCPECAKQGKKKLLLKVGSDAKGTLYPLCKIHREVKVTIPAKPNT